MENLTPGLQTNISTLLQMSREGKEEYIAATFRKYLKDNNLTELQLFQLIDTNEDGVLSRVEIQNFFSSALDSNGKPLFAGYREAAIPDTIHDELCKKLLKNKDSELNRFDYLNTLIEDAAHDQVVFSYEQVFEGAERPDSELFYTLNISWDLTNVPISSFSTSQTSFINDRPRINTFRSDGISEGAVYLSAGYIYQNPTPQSVAAVAAPWGDRNKLTQQVIIPFKTGESAGIDFHTTDWMPTPYLDPSYSNWQLTDTANATEKKWQILFSEPGIYNVTLSATAGNYPGGKPSV